MKTKTATATATAMSVPMAMAVDGDGGRVRIGEHELFLLSVSPLQGPTLEPHLPLDS